MLIPVLSACNFVVGMGAFVVIGLLTPLSDDLSVSAAQAGWVMTIYALSYAVLSPLLVSATGRVGRRKIMAAGFAIFGIACALIALSPTFTGVLLARILAAAGAGIYTPVAAVVAAALSPEESRGKALAAVFFGLTLAQVVGVPLGSWMAYTFGWRTAVGLVAILSVPCVWLIWTKVPAGLSFQPVSLKDLGTTLMDGATMLAVAFTATFLAGIYVVYTYIGPLLTETMGYGRDGITLALLAFGIGAVLGNLAGGWLADAIGPVRTLVMLALGQIALMPLFSGLPYSDVALMLLMLFWSVFGWSFLAGQQVRLISLAPEKAGVVLSLNAAAIYVGAAVGSAIGGAVISGFGLYALGAAGGIVALGALGNILWSHRMINLRSS